MFSKTKCVGRLCPPSLEVINVSGFVKRVILIPYIETDKGYYVQTFNDELLKIECKDKYPFTCSEEALEKYKVKSRNITHIHFIGDKKPDEMIIFIKRDDKNGNGFIKITPKLEYSQQIQYVLGSEIERSFMKQPDIATYHILTRLEGNDLLNFCKTNVFQKECRQRIINIINEKTKKDPSKLNDKQLYRLYDLMVSSNFDLNIWINIQSNGLYLKEIPEEKRTYKLYLEAIKQNGIALEYVPKEKKTEEICLEAVKQNGNALKYVPKEKRTTKVCLEAVKQNGNALKYVPEEKRTEEICLEAVKQDGYALEYVPEEKRTEKIYLEAVKQNGNALYYVSIGTEEIYLEAVKQNGLALMYVPKEKRTEEICLEAVKRDGYALEYVPEEKRTEKIYLEAVKQNGTALIHVPKEKRTYELYLEVIKV